MSFQIKIMQFISKYLKGDLALWGIIFLFAFISFLPVYSSSSHLVYGTARGGDTMVYLLRHFLLIVLGIGIIFLVHRVQYRYFRPLSRLGLILSVVFLVIALLKGTQIEGANASRWLVIMGISFQPSALAHIVLMVYVASYLSDNYERKITYKISFLTLWLPVFTIIGLVVIANLSTGLIMFAMILMLVFVGKYPMKHIFTTLVISVFAMSFFLLLVKAFPDAFPNRVDTWISRIENFVSDNPQEKDTYQIDHAKMAIASGGLTGLGAGKSVMRNFLPASSSDFIYAITVEEYGIIFGGMGLIILYCLMLLRMVVISGKAPNIFGKLLVIGVGFSVVFQAFINMGVAVGLLPVTGQTLPFITTGGTSIWMTCLSMGIILAVSAKSDSGKNQASTSTKTKEKSTSEEDSSQDISLGRETLEEISEQG